MKRSTHLSAAFLILLAAAMQVPAGAVTHAVSVRNLEFDPAEVTIREGDAVRWIWETDLPGAPCAATPGWIYG